MIDRIVMQIKGVAPSLIDLKLEDVMGIFDEFKGKQIGVRNSLTYTYYKSRAILKIEGSLHKFVKENNYELFTYSEAVTALQEIASFLEIPLSAFRINSIEIGVNIPVNELPIRYIETISEYKGNKFIPMTPRTGTNKIYGRRCKLSGYEIKFYDKIADYIREKKIKVADRERLPKNLLRYEIKLSRKQLMTFRFPDPTAENLLKRRYAIFCVYLLRSIMKDIVFTNDMVDYSKIPDCSSKVLQNRIKRYIFAVSDGYDRYLAYLKDYVGENEYKKAKRSKIRLIKSMHPFLYGKYEKELKERFVEEIAKVHDYKRAVKSKKV
jgi:ribosomal protein S17E